MPKDLRLFATVAARWRAIAANRRAVTAMEYSLIASLIALLIIAAISSIGSSISSTFHTVATAL
jgi:pilus assembly protein Flp/PilA